MENDYDHTEAFRSAAGDIVDASRYYADAVELLYGKPPSLENIQNIRGEVRDLVRELRFVDGLLRDLEHIFAGPEQGREGAAV